MRRTHLYNITYILLEPDPPRLTIRVNEFLYYDGDITDTVTPTNNSNKSNNITIACTSIMISRSQVRL